MEAGKVEVNGSTVEGLSIHRVGIVEGTRVPDVVLDTGCSQTIVRRDIVPEEKTVAGEPIMLCCVHGDTVLYPLAERRTAPGPQRQRTHHWVCRERISR